MLRGLILATGFAAGMPAADAAKEDLKNGQGQWTIAAVELDGKDATDAFKEAKVTVKDGRATLRFPKGMELAWTFLRDATSRPKCIDFKNDKGETTEGIYVFKKDELKICVYVRGGVAERPGGFTTASGSGRILWVLRRSKP